jgi:DNA-binding transcriptional ArsR family regulator
LHLPVLVLAALADPVRRQIVELLGRGELGAGEIAARFPVSWPAVSRHLRVLREAGLVVSDVRGQHRTYRLTPAPLAALDEWLDQFRPLSAAEAPPAGLPGPAGRLDALDTEVRRGRRQRARASGPAPTRRSDDRDRSAG